MVGTHAIEHDSPGPAANRDDRLHRGRNVVLAFLMQGWGQVSSNHSATLVSFCWSQELTKYILGFQSSRTSHSSHHLLEWQNYSTVLSRGCPAYFQSFIRSSGNFTRVVDLLSTLHYAK